MCILVLFGGREVHQLIPRPARTPDELAADKSDLGIAADDRSQREVVARVALGCEQFLGGGEPAGRSPVASSDGAHERAPSRAAGLVEQLAGDGEASRIPRWSRPRREMRGSLESARGRVLIATAAVRNRSSSSGTTTQVNVRANSAAIATCAQAMSSRPSSAANADSNRPSARCSPSSNWTNGPMHNISAWSSSGRLTHAHRAAAVRLARLGGIASRIVRLQSKWTLRSSAQPAQNSAWASRAATNSPASSSRSSA